MLLTSKKYSKDSQSSESISSLQSLVEGTNETSEACPETLALERLVNGIRFLAADTVLHAKSGHTGMPMGMAPAACTLWDKHMIYNPENPSWMNRDRFVLSAGHGSALLYSLLYVFGFQDSISIADLRSFRQRGSRAAGHPENCLTTAVEVTTGALGQGICNAVGFAIAETHLAAVYNRPDFKIVDHHTYAIVGDGCLMEGTSAEACSLAGHLRLGKLIVLYDDNKISIEGSTDLAFTEDVEKRFKAYGWQVLTVSNGNTDYISISGALRAAKEEYEKPTLIKISTTIGFGMPNLAGSAEIHGPCLDADEISEAKRALQWNYGPFEVPEDVISYARRERATAGSTIESKWNETLSDYGKIYPKLAAKFEKEVLQAKLPQSLDNTFEKIYAMDGKSDATRKISGRVLNTLADTVPALIGGSADLAPSTATYLSKFSSFQANSCSGRNIHFGVREHAMGSISNGIALHGTGLVPFCSTFLVFTDYCRAAIRTAALSKAGVIFILTHDSVLLGQDGPTHQPVEHLSSLRSMPGILTIRPADHVEVTAAYEIALYRRRGPTCLILSRQSFSAPRGSREGSWRGAYIHSDNTSEGDSPDIIVIATGSELGLVYEVADDLRNRGCRLRIVSMPCMELFLEQPETYQRTVLSPEVDRNHRLVVEAGCSFGWHRFADHMLTVDNFGLSAPTNQIKDYFGLTACNLISKIDEILL